MNKVNVPHVPFTGAAPAVTATMGGQVPLAWVALPGAFEQVKSKTVKGVAIATAKRIPELPDVPTVVSLAKTDQQRQALELLFARDAIAFPFLAPPDVPADHAKLLQQAFADSFRDPELLADAKKAAFDISLVTGDQVQAIIKKAFATPPEVIALTRKAMGR
jgi:tripartite-type tricarboxylate transporter receptor subunit TctC